MQESAQILLKSISLFFLVWVAIRLMGKRNMSQISPYNFVSYIVIAIVAALMSINPFVINFIMTNIDILIPYTI